MRTYSRNFYSPLNAFHDIKWVAPIRAEPKRIYENSPIKSNPDGSHAPLLLKDILSNSKSKAATGVKKFIELFGKDSHLFDSIKIKKFGTEKFSPFELQVTLNGRDHSISNVGYGVSQVLPLLLDIYIDNSNYFANQQPEIHLHPRAQAEFGELIYSALFNTDKTFFIETHSDYTIDRFRLCMNRGNHLQSEDAQIIFFQRHNSGNSAEIIPISSDGKYPEEQPKNFREFFINESIDLLGI